MMIGGAPVLGLREGAQAMVIFIRQERTGVLSL